MRIHDVVVEKTSGDLPMEDQLAWKIAEVASQATKVGIDDDVRAMVKNRLIDNAAIAIAAINERAVAVARAKALPSEGVGGATLYGVDNGRTFAPEKAAFANAVAVRFLDQDDTYLAAEYSHPDDNISPMLAVAQHMGLSGQDLIRGIVVAYEIQVALVGTGHGTGISLHRHKVDHMTHIAAGTAAGIGAMLNLSTVEIYNAVNFAVHNSVSSRQSRKGKIGAQKEFVPGFSAEIAIDAVNSAMNGLMGPNPVYEGVDSIVTQFLDGPDSTYKIELAEPGKDSLRNILITYPKEHSFEYQGQAIIDLALEMRQQVMDRGGIGQIRHIELQTSHHTHHVIGTDANDPEKTDLNSPRGTLDHSIMFAIARTMELGEWHHERSYQAIRDNQALADLLKKVETTFDEQWEKRYHSTDPQEQAFGGKMIITFADGSRIEDEKAVANAHVYGASPWGRPEYVKKFRDLTAGMCSVQEQDRLGGEVEKLETLTGPELRGLTAKLDAAVLEGAPSKGIYGSGR
ncbi:MAG: MmgE/PrpD family protein [Chloroflexi bacterium]|nr:MmgE/PrpD family protein [Chloroflexota bacterium]MDA1228983.1 MmgE/PrpD family protein [Chloroflexota bacterium]